MPTAVPILTAGQSVCIAELDRKPQGTWEERFLKVARPGRVVPLAHYDCFYDPGEAPDKWLPAITAEVYATLDRAPIGARCIGISGQRFGTPHDEITPEVKLDADIHTKQLQRLVYDAGYEAHRPDLIFVDSENNWANAIGRRAYWRLLTSVFGDIPVALWNHVRGTDRIPCGYWAGEGFMGLPIPGGVSNPQTYIGWYSPSGVNEPAKLTPEYMWTEWIRTINAIRSCLAGGQGCIPHLPVCHPDAALARRYTIQTIIHARLAGCTRFFWATYMSDEWSLMADAIATALATADAMAAEPGRIAYRSSAISTNARVVTTRGFATRKP